MFLFELSCVTFDYRPLATLLDLPTLSVVMATNGTSNNVLNQCGKTCNLIRCWKWDVSRIISRQFQCQAKYTYAVIVLNRPLTQNHAFLASLWNDALVRVTVDGGTNQWDKFVKDFSENEKNTIKLPNLITGDFDSVRPEILQRYEAKGCKVIHTPDQDQTDFTKALIELNKWCKVQNLEIDHAIAIGQCSGRLDQIMGNIQTLFLAKDNLLLGLKTRLYLLTDDAISWLLQPGDHIINIPEMTRTHKRAWCSLVPVGETCSRITTTGLKWNLDNQTLKFGEIVSTSNTFDGSEHVTVKCTNTVLWSMKIPSVKDA